MNYYARYNTKGEYETLEEHLAKVARLCGDYCSEFTKREIGELAGWLHDAGKRTARFQNVLNKRETNVNHAVIGGIIGNLKGFNNLCQTDKILMDILTDIIIAHHSEIKGNEYDKEIPDSWNNPLYDKKYAVSTADELKDICLYYKENILNGKINPIDYSYNENGSMTNIQKMLYERMLLSCLVDADYSSSASFEQDDYLEATEIELNPQECLSKLENYRNALIKDTDKTNEMNCIRSHVYSCCSKTPIIKRNGGLFKLTAPTGSAKTLGMLKWALLCAEKYNKKRVFTVLPFLSVISQTVEIYRDIFGKDFVLEDDSQVEQLTEKERELSSRWTSPIIVPTMVKFLEGLFVSGAVPSRRLHNICNSVILFDEFQSIPPHILSTTLEALRELANRYGCIILFSSATSPNFSARKDLEWWNEEVVEIIDNVEKLYEDYAKAKEINVSWCLHDKSDVQQIAKKVLENNNSCCIVNTKKNATEIFDELVKSKDESECFLISTALCSKHRANIIKEVKYRQRNGLTVYISATQCIEAGVDTSSEYLYREIAPLEAIVQSAGRCARNAECIGKFTVFAMAKELHPDISYKNAKEITKALYEIYNKKIDINNTKQLEEYYKILYTINGFDKDVSKLTSAIENLNFVDVKDAYNVIDEKEQFRIIVPYSGAQKDYDNFLQIYEQNNGVVEAKQLKKVQGITVGTFNSLFKKFCYPVLIETTHHPEGLNNNIYILLPNTAGIEYNEKRGLIMSGSKSEAFIF